MEDETTIHAGEAMGKCLQWACSPRGGNNFYGRVLNGCGRQTNEGLGTCGVRIDSQGRYLMEWDPEWFVTKNEPFQILVIVHEAAHLILRHIERGNQIKRRMQDDAKSAKVYEVMNVAMDLAVNDTSIRPLISDRHLNFAECYDEFIWPEEKEYPRGLSFEEYLVLLLKDLKESGWSPDDEHSAMPTPRAGQGQSEDGKGEGQSGSGSGEEQQESKGGGSGSSSGEGDKQKGKGGGGGGGKDKEKQDGEVPGWFQRLLDKKHKSVEWSKDFDNMTDGEMRRAMDRAKREARKITRQAANQTRKACGTIPGAVQSIVEELMAEPVIPWQDVLRGMLKSKISQKLDESTAYPNVALLHDDSFEPYPGFQNDFAFNILAAFDTSGSMSHDEFKDCRKELCGLLEKGGGVTVRLIQFDWGIQHEVELTEDDTQDVKKSFSRYGHGGTSFSEPLRHALDKTTDADWIDGAKREDKYGGPYDLMLMFTDGGAHVPLPELDPKIPLIWVLTSSGYVSKEMKQILWMTT